MSGPLPRHSLVLAVHPTKDGMGWVVFEGPFTPYDWGLVSARKDKNAFCLKKVERLIERLQPETFVVEAYDRVRASRADRVTRVCRDFVNLAASYGIAVEVYDRAAIRRAFAGVGAITRQDVAEAVARYIDAFRHRLPAKRKDWEAEDRRMALFSAAALAITYFQNEGPSLP